MKKKLLSFTLALLMLLAMSVPAFAAETVISVKPPETLPKAGETFTVTVEISGNPGICAAQFALVFDKTAMSCTQAKLGTVLNGMLSATNPNGSKGAIIAAAATEEVEDNGALATFKFTAEKDITAWNFALSDLSFSRMGGVTVPFTVSKETLITPETTEEPETPAAPETPETPETPTEPETPAEQEQAGIGTGYPDVKGEDAEYVNYATEHGLFQGYADGTFRPNNAVTRGAYVAVLWRLAGKPAAPAASFSDIGTCNDDFKKAIAWASSKGYVDGYADGTFRPMSAVSRRAALKILYHYNGGVSGTEMMLTSIYDAAFTDGKTLSAVFKAPVYWGYYYKLIESDSETSLGAARDATRAELARIFALYAEMVG